MFDADPLPDAFGTLRDVIRAWSRTTAALIAEAGGTADAKTRRTHARKLSDTDTMLALGYLVGNERRGQVAIMQATIVNALVAAAEYDDDAEAEAEKRRLRQDLRRRFDALEHFGLVQRTYLTPTAVQLSLTDAGRGLRARFDAAFAQRAAETAVALSA